MGPINLRNKSRDKRNWFKK